MRSVGEGKTKGYSIISVEKDIHQEVTCIQTFKGLKGTIPHKDGPNQLRNFIFISMKGSSDEPATATRLSLCNPHRQKCSMHNSLPF